MYGMGYGMGVARDALALKKGPDKSKQQKNDHAERRLGLSLGQSRLRFNAFPRRSLGLSLRFSGGSNPPQKVGGLPWRLCQASFLHTQIE